MLKLSKILLFFFQLSVISILSEYSLGIKDSFMIAHSFKGKEFGPAQALHGATYTVDVEFITSSLEKDLNWVIDIGQASNILSSVLSKYNFKNLDEIFPEDNTTTEFMCKLLHKDLSSYLLKEKCFQGTLKVKLWESHKAWATYSKLVK